MDYLFAKIGPPYLTTTFQPKGSRFDPFFKKKNSSMNKMDEKKKVSRQLLHARCPKEKRILSKEKETKW